MKAFQHLIIEDAATVVVSLKDDRLRIVVRGGIAGLTEHLVVEVVHLERLDLPGRRKNVQDV